MMVQPSAAAFLPDEDKAQMLATLKVEGIDGNITFPKSPASEHAVLGFFVFEVAFERVAPILAAQFCSANTPLHFFSLDRDSGYFDAITSAYSVSGDQRDTLYEQYRSMPDGDNVADALSIAARRTLFIPDDLSWALYGETDWELGVLFCFDGGQRLQMQAAMQEFAYENAASFCDEYLLKVLKNTPEIVQFSRDLVRTFDRKKD